MNVEESYNIAEDYYEKGIYKEALNHFLHINNIEKSDRCDYYIGLCYFYLNDYEKALDILVELSICLPQNDLPIQAIGRVYMEMGDLDKAFKYFHRAIEIDPRSDSNYFYIGLYYYKIGDYTNAKTSFIKALSIYEDDDTHYNLGLCYYKQKYYDMALKEFENAILINESNFDYKFMKNKTLVYLNKYQLAKEGFMSLLGTDKMNTDVMVEIAYCLLKLEDYEDARIWADQALSVMPDNKLANKIISKINSD